VRVITPKQIVQQEFDGLIKLVDNIFVINKNRDHYLKQGLPLHNFMGIMREHGEYVKERLEGSRDLCMDMTVISIDPKEIERIVRDHFYTGPLSGSTERLVKALTEYLEKL
jgi:hypothetical protein